MQNLNVNGDLREIENLGDQITAQIMKKLAHNPEHQKQKQQINVYNNFEPQNLKVSA